MVDGCPGANIGCFVVYEVLAAHDHIAEVAQTDIYAEHSFFVGHFFGQKMDSTSERIIFEQQKEIERLRTRLEHLSLLTMSINQDTARPAATLYHVMDGDKIVYVGVDKSLKQTRIGNHRLKAKHIQQHSQLVDIALAVKPEMRFVVVKKGSCQEIIEAERNHIKEHKPIYNQQHRPEALADRCSKCNRPFKYRNAFDKHVKKCTS